MVASNVYTHPSCHAHSCLYYLQFVDPLTASPKTKTKPRLNLCPLDLIFNWGVHQASNSQVQNLSRVVCVWLTHTHTHTGGFWLIILYIWYFLIPVPLPWCDDQWALFRVVKLGFHRGHCYHIWGLGNKTGGKLSEQWIGTETVSAHRSISCDNQIGLFGVRWLKPRPQ